MAGARRLGRAGDLGAQLEPAYRGICFVTDRELEAAAALRRLTHLSLAGMSEHWRAAALLKLVRALPALSSLDLSRCAQVQCSTLLTA